MMDIIWNFISMLWYQGKILLILYKSHPRVRIPLFQIIKKKEAQKSHTSLDLYILLQRFFYIAIIQYMFILSRFYFKLAYQIQVRPYNIFKLSLELTCMNLCFGEVDWCFDQKSGLPSSLDSYDSLAIAMKLFSTTFIIP